MSWLEAGALSASGQTAATVLTDLGVGPDDTVLIHGAAGGVGTMAVQIAIARGAAVIGTASERNHEYLRSLGATPVEYGPGLADRARTASGGSVDAAFDTAGTEEALAASAELVADRSRIGTIVFRAPAEEYSVRRLSSRRSREQLSELVGLHAAGRLRVEIQRKFTLEQAADAHRELESGHVRGKLVFEIG
jgi:NADPH:quinone reductase-like Zn-dependent oxidoreductase